jgi:hypothetical protein
MRIHGNIDGNNIEKSAQEKIGKRTRLLKYVSLVPFAMKNQKKKKRSQRANNLLQQKKMKKKKEKKEMLKAILISTTHWL